MCDPITITTVAGLAISAAGTGAAYLNQQQQAKRTDKALLDQANANNASMGERMKQINANAADQMSQRARAALIERGRLDAAAADSGLGDNSGRTMFESLFNESTDVAHLQSNNAANLRQAGADALGYTAQVQSNINRVARPSLVDAGLQIGGAGLTAYDKTHPGTPAAPASTAPDDYGYSAETGLSKKY